MRLLTDAASKRMGVPIVVLNRPGAGGAIGHREIVSAKPDGYTIGMFSSGGIASQYTNPNANTIEEMQPIAFFGEDPGAMQASVASGITSLKEVVEQRPRRARKDSQRQRSAGRLLLHQYRDVREADELQGHARALCRL